MKKFGILMLMLSLVGFAVGCSNEEPSEPAAPADTTTPEDGGGDGGTADGETEETPAE